MTPLSDSTDARTRGPRGAHVGLAILALAMGGFAIGTTEFVSMGLLPQVARGVDVSIPSAGHAISAYAVGVVVGAPAIAFLGSGWPRRAVLIGLMTLFALGNAATAVVTSYPGLLAARFVSGLPHGAFFGVASLLAASLARPGRQGRAVAKVMLGLSFANVAGVPAATWLGQNLGWRSAYWLVAALALVTLALVTAFVPTRPGDPSASWRRELRALGDPQVLLTLVAGAIGFGGMFAVYTYVVPTLTEVGGLPESAAPVFLLAFGLGMVAGTWLAGELAAWSVFRSLFIGGGGQGLLLLVFALAAPAGWWTLPVVFGITATGSVLVVNLQLRLMDVAGDAQTIGAAMNHASLNLANALGAWLGGLVIAAGWGYRAPAVVGFGLSMLGLVVLGLSARLHVGERRRTALR
ncbi:MFS transporter [Nocardioides sp. 616]|uniref:MFS transporter n=1 Tax=Nocardioides sp. 616 TaxID=2268090 RepID=UPI000CE3F4CD|nr:MFS transporter [Nocardioides sp. 616]